MDYNFIDYDISLQTNDEDLQFSMEKFSKSNIEPFSCYLKIKSNGFMYEGEIFFDNFIDFKNNIHDMKKTLTGCAELKENYHNHYIRFTIDELGHLFVEGKIIEYSENGQNLYFKFKTDQTCLEKFSYDLEQINLLK